MSYDAAIRLAHFSSVLTATPESAGPLAFFTVDGSTRLRDLPECADLPYRCWCRRLSHFVAISPRIDRCCLRPRAGYRCGGVSRAIQGLRRNRAHGGAMLY